MPMRKKFTLTTRSYFQWPYRYRPRFMLFFTSIIETIGVELFPLKQPETNETGQSSGTLARRERGCSQSSSPYSLLQPCDSHGFLKTQGRHCSRRCGLSSQESRPAQLSLLQVTQSIRFSSLTLPNPMSRPLEGVETSKTTRNKAETENPVFLLDPEHVTTIARQSFFQPRGDGNTELRRLETYGPVRPGGARCVWGESLEPIR